MPNIQTFTWGDFSGGLAENSYKGNPNQFTEGKGIDIFTNPFIGQLGTQIITRQNRSFGGIEQDTNKIILDSPIIIQNSNEYVDISNNSIKKQINRSGYSFLFYIGDNLNEQLENRGKYMMVGARDVKVLSNTWNEEKIVTYPNNNSEVPRAILQVYNTLLIAKEYEVFELSLTTETLKSEAVIDTIPKNYRIHKMHFQNDELIVIAQQKDREKNIAIYKFQWDGGRYDIAYKNDILNEIYKDSIQENARTWIITNTGIYAHEGMQALKFYDKNFHNGEVKMGFIDGKLHIKHNYTLYKFAQPFRGGNYALINTAIEIDDFYNNVFIKNQRIYYLSQTYQKQGEFISNTLDGDSAVEKKIKGMRVAYILPKIKDNEVPTSIEVWIRLNTLKIGKFVKIATIKDAEKTVEYIGEYEIAKRLEEVGISNIASDIKIKIVLNAGGKGVNNTLSETPIIRKIDLFYNPVNNENPN